MKLNSIINIPYNFKIVVWKNTLKKIVFIWFLKNNKNYKIVYKNNNCIQIDKWTNSLILKNYKILGEVKSVNKLIKLLKSLNTYFFKKIKFKGKGFRIKFFKKIKFIKFFFGKSHKTFFYLKKIKYKKINKYKFMVFNLNYCKLKKTSIKICNIKKINFYTLRGIRLSRQIIYKRKGKKGTYI